MAWPRIAAACVGVTGRALSLLVSARIAEVPTAKPATSRAAAVKVSNVLRFVSRSVTELNISILSVLSRRLVRVRVYVQGVNAAVLQVQTAVVLHVLLPSAD